MTLQGEPEVAASPGDNSRHATLSRNLLGGIACAILSILLFSSFTLASRRGLSSALKPPDITALRFGIGGVVLLPVLLRRGLGDVRWRDAAGLAVFGGLGFALLAYSGFSLAPAAHGAVLLHGTLPLTTFAIQNLVGAQRGTRGQVIGMAIIAAGVLLMAYDSLVEAHPRQLLGDGLLMLASGSWSAYGVALRRLGLPAAQGAAIVAVFSLCAYLPIYAVLRRAALFHTSPHELLLQVLVQGVLIGAVSIFVYSRAVASLGPSTTALFTAAVPCVTTLAAAPLLSEFPSPVAVVGVAMVTLGMLVTARAQWSERESGHRP